MKTVTKPWGSYKDYFRCKFIVFKTLSISENEETSLQSHNDRNEIWYVSSGVGLITGYKRKIILEGDFVFIGKNKKHQLKNIHDEELKVLEVQFGFNCSEDDIIRYEDKYGRSKIERPIEASDEAIQDVKDWTKHMDEDTKNEILRN